MLEYTPEDFGSMKERYHLAVAEPVDTAKVRDKLIPAPSKDRKHVFDYPDGMRLVVSVDFVIDQEFLHVIASGTDGYAKSIKDEGLDGITEDLMLRLCALRGSAPPNKIKSFNTNGVLHIMFYD